MSAARRWQVAALGLLMALLAVLRLAHAGADDDTLYLAWLAAPPGAAARQDEAALAARLAQAPGCELAAWRVDFRARYAGNYAGWLLFPAAAGALAPAEATTPDPVERALDRLRGGQAAALAFAAMLLLALAAHARDNRLGAAAVLALTLTVLGEIAGEAGLLRPSLWNLDLSHGPRALAQIGLAVLIPPPASALLGMTPRNLALALFAAALLLKWRDRPLGAGLALVAAGLAHQTYGGIALGLFTGAALVSTPALLGAWRLRLPLLAGAALWGARESYFGAGALPLLLAPGCVAAMIALAALPPWQRQRERLAGPLAEIPADALAIAAAGAAATAIALIAAPAASEVERLYVWTDLASRLWSFARFPLLAALAWFAVPRVAALPIGAESAALALTALALIAAPSRPPAPPLPSGPVEVLPRDEGRLYAALIRARPLPATTPACRGKPL